MRVYLAQHGLAVPKEVNPERPLSEQGRRDLEQMAEFLDRAGIRVEQVFHSGKTRAEQTAVELAHFLSPAGQVLAQTGLGPKDPVEPFAEQIKVWTVDTLVVGHLPFLGRLVSLLLAEDADRTRIAFQPGSLVCLDQEAEAGWALAWMIRPELLNPSGAE